MVCHTPVNVSVRIVGLYLDGLIVIVDGTPEIFQPVFGNSPVKIGFGKVWLKLDHDVEVFDGPNIIPNGNTCLPNPDIMVYI
jgi:hypothetical protein